MRRLILIVLGLLVFLGVWNAGSSYFQKGVKLELPTEKVKILTEESVVIDAVKKVSPSVVTVAGDSSSLGENFEFGPFSIFGVPRQRDSDESQGIGSGFIVSKDGLIITNKHVVSDIGAKYQIITADDKKFAVEKIYRDPLNDVAILQINPPNGLKPIALGDSSRLQVGQFVIAIGTALGEFKSTVTTGVISGLGRGITAGSEFEGFVERLDNVIQTDAAINPGNSGGPLLNSKAEVIGVNTAIAASGQNIGFALPINIIKDSLDNFNKSGQFNRPYLGIVYRSITRETAILNNVPQGAYIQDVVEDSPAEKAGVQKGDILTKIDDQKIQQNEDVSKIIGGKKIGDTITITLWRDEKTIEVKAILVVAPNQ